MSEKLKFKEAKKVKDIMDELTSINDKHRVAFWNQLIKTTISERDLNVMLEEEQKGAKLTTGTLIDELIGGGMKPKSSALLYGEYASGKTQACFTMAVRCPSQVIYLDSEGTFSANRIKQICDASGLNYQDIFKKIHLFDIENWIQQLYVVYHLPSPADIGDVGLIILDSLIKQFRGLEFSGRENLGMRQALIRQNLMDLETMARNYNSALIYTTQVYEDVSGGVSPYMPDWVSQQMSGGKSLEHAPSYVIFLRKGEGNVRIAQLQDSSWVAQGERPFLITEKGIEDLPRTEKAEKLIETTIKRSEEIQKVMEKSLKKKEGD